MFKDDVQRILMRETGNVKVQEDKKETTMENKDNKDNKEHEMSPKNFIHG